MVSRKTVNGLQLSSVRKSLPCYHLHYFKLCITMVIDSFHFITSSSYNSATYQGSLSCTVLLQKFRVCFCISPPYISLFIGICHRLIWKEHKFQHRSQEIQAWCITLHWGNPVSCSIFKPRNPDRKRFMKPGFAGTNSSMKESCSD